MAFADPNIGGSNPVGDLFSWIIGGLAGADGSIFGLAIVGLVALVSFAGSKAFSYDRALGVSGFLTLAVSFIFLRLGWITDGIFSLVVIYFVIGLYFLIKERGGEES
jgi:hypothetical protein